jgi:hypothetical protein
MKSASDRLALFEQQSGLWYCQFCGEKDETMDSATCVDPEEVYASAPPTASLSSSDQHFTQFSAEIKHPAKGSEFPVIGTDVQRNAISVSCSDCNGLLEVRFASAKRYDVFAVCDECNLHFKKHKVSTNRAGIQCVRMAGFKRKTDPPAPPFLFKGKSQPMISHPFPFVQKRKEREKQTAQSSNKRIRSRGEKELQERYT